MARIVMKKAWISAAILCASVMGWSVSARAECPTAALPYSFDYGSVAVPNSLGVGAVIPGTERSFRLKGTCASATTFNKDVVACPKTAAVSGMADVYPTGLAGVGMRMRNQNGVPMVPIATVPVFTSSKVPETSKFPASSVLPSDEFVEQA